MEINKTDVGSRIYSLRKTKAMSMDDLAKAISVSGKSTVNEWEKGRSLPNKKSLSAMAELFRTSPNFILYGPLPEYITNVLENDGINDATFNDLVWKYIDLTTNTFDMMTGIAFDSDSGKPVDDDVQNKIDSSIETGAIERAISDNIGFLVSEFSIDDDNLNNEYPSSPAIIKAACKVFQTSIKMKKNSFTGKIHRIHQLFRQIDSYEFLNSNITLEEYLNDDDPVQPWGINTKRPSNEFIIDHFYQAQLNNKLMDFQEELSQLDMEYHESLDKYSPKNK